MEPCSEGAVAEKWARRRARASGWSAVDILRIDINRLKVLGNEEFAETSFVGESL